MDMTAEARIRDFLAQRFLLKGEGAAVDDDEPLFSSGRLDSLDAVETILFLETEYAVDFAALNFDLTLLDSIAAIARLVNARGR